MVARGLCVRDAEEGGIVGEEAAIIDGEDWASWGPGLPGPTLEELRLGEEAAARFFVEELDEVAKVRREEPVLPVLAVDRFRGTEAAGVDAERDGEEAGGSCASTR